MDFITHILYLARASLDLPLGSVAIGSSLTGGALLNVAFLGLSGVLVVTRRGSLFPFLVWLPFLTVAGLSVAWAPDKSSAIRLFVLLVTYAGFFAIPFLLNGNSRRNVSLLKPIIYSSVVPACYAVAEYVLFPEADGRLKSTFGHPNIFAFYLTIIIGVIFFLMRSTVAQFTPLFKKIMFLYLGFLFGLVLLTQTRGAWIGIIIIIAAFALFVDRRFLFGIVLLPGVLLVPGVADRLSDLNKGTTYSGEMRSADDTLNSYAWRQVMWEAAMRDSEDARILGKGLASFGPNSVVFFPLANQERNYTSKGVGAHSVFVQTLYETGVVGVACFAFMFLALIVRAWQFRYLDPPGAIVIISVVVAFAAANASDNVYDYGSAHQYFWGFMGVVFAKWQQMAAEARSSRADSKITFDAMDQRPRSVLAGGR